MLMKNLYLIVALLSVAFLSVAQSGNATNDPAAKKVLDAVSSKFKTFKGVQATFVLQVEDGKGKVQGTKKGTVYMKGPKYRVNLSGTDEGAGQDIYFDGSNVWTYDQSANEVTITKPDEATGTLTPQKLFTDFYDKDFLYKMNGEKKEGNKVLQEIEMTPVDKTKAFHKVYVLVDKKAQTIYRTRVLDKSGNRYSYTINSLNGNASVNDGLFVFDKSKYPGVEEVDLR